MVQSDGRCRSTSAKGRKGVFGKLGCRDGEILQLEKPFLDHCVLVYFQLAAGSTTAGCPGLPGGEICKRLCQCAGTSFARQDRAAAAGAGKSFSRRSAPRRGYYGARAVPAALWIQPQVLTQHPGRLPRFHIFFNFVISSEPKPPNHVCTTTSSQRGRSRHHNPPQSHPGATLGGASASPAFQPSSARRPEMIHPFLGTRSYSYLLHTTVLHSASNPMADDRSRASCASHPHAPTLRTLVRSSSPVPATPVSKLDEAIALASALSYRPLAF